MWEKILYIDILDLGCGNNISIQNWVKKAGHEPHLVGRSKRQKSDLLVLPGVGSAFNFMSCLRSNGMNRLLANHIKIGGRVLGICVGMQVLADFSEEGSTKCLGVINGTVEKLVRKSNNGWAPLSIRKEALGGWPNGLGRQSLITGRVYYNHEYGFRPENDCDVISSFTLDTRSFASIVVKDNIAGVQFHPEKSQRTGIDILRMFSGGQ